MRFPLAAILFVIAGFIFFFLWAVCSFVLTEVETALTPLIPLLSSDSQTMMNNQMTLITTGFGIFSALFFLVGILLVFFADSWRTDPEYYYYR